MNSIDIDDEAPMIFASCLSGNVTLKELEITKSRMSRMVPGAK